jgi:hypothetical protein
MHVEEKGAYFVMAELWGGQDGITPIAFGRERLGDVPTGDRKTTLLFGGQVIRDSGVDGPYVVRNVTLSRVSTLPPHQAEPIASLPSTPPFRANDFY